MDVKFYKLKEEILKRAKENNACREQYLRAYKSENSKELLQVVKDNFSWVCERGVIDGGLIDRFQDVFNENEIWHNKDIFKGFAIVSGSSTVNASGSSTVRASGSSTVEASGNSTVYASGISTVYASDFSTVEASGNSTVYASGISTVYASGLSTVRASGLSTVRASGSAYINCSSKIECKISEKSIVRRHDTNTIQFCSDELKFEKI